MKALKVLRDERCVSVHININDHNGVMQNFTNELMFQNDKFIHLNVTAHQQKGDI
jgi:hypothetical protein